MTHRPNHYGTSRDATRDEMSVLGGLVGSSPVWGKSERMSGLALLDRLVALVPILPQLRVVVL